MAPSLHGRYPLLRYYGPLRLPAWAAPWLCIPSGRWGRLSSPALPGLPGSSTVLFLRAVPNHPGRSGGCLLIASPPISGFILFGRLATFTLRHEAESGSLTLRLAGLLPRFPPDGLLHLAPVQLHARTSNLHGELLSVHKIKPGLTWYSKGADEAAKALGVDLIWDGPTELDPARQNEVV